jgi:hypothetical protein
VDASSRGPTQRRYAATVNSARLTGGLEALDALQDALAKARRQAIDLHTAQDAESLAEAALALYETWRTEQQYRPGSTW